MAMITQPGVPWPLLPCEVHLEQSLESLALGACPEDRNELVLAVLRAHPFIEVKGKPGGGPCTDLGGRLGVVAEEHFKLSLSAFRSWLKKDEGKPFNERGLLRPSDDGIYTKSAVLRRCMPRGLSVISFSGSPGTTFIIRGFRKFTGLTASDEDEESEATEHGEDFYLAPKCLATRFAVTTKSNGENGKFAVREAQGEVVLLAGSKNTCLAWRAEQDVAEVHPLGDPAFPAPFIAEKMQRFWRGWGEGTRQAFVDRVAQDQLTLMLEHNSSIHEHVFPIPEDFVEFVAVLDREGLPVSQNVAFQLFDEFHLPRVRCEMGLSLESLPEKLAEERAATDREGAVLYLETDDGAPVALLKVKSDFYVQARRTRQTIWCGLVDPLLRFKSLQSEEAQQFLEGVRADGTKAKTGWDSVAARLASGMQGLTHLESCAANWKAWAETAVGFLQWFRKHYEAAASDGDRKAFLSMTKNRFGTVYRNYCRDLGLRGGDN